jgi:hypothetical protein
VNRLLSAAALVPALAFGAIALAGTPQDTATTVPALDAFHEVIMPMWHTAYPNKDYAALRGVAKDVEAGIAKIAAAKLPGMLREKEAAWAKGLANLTAAGSAYTKAASGGDKAALLAAAEKLHSAYEAQVQVIRPVVPEMDEFHKVLYVVQHTYVPARNWAAVCAASGDLQAKAESLAAATLSKRAAAQADEFKQASGALVADAKALVAACTGDQPAAIEKATDTLHSGYEALGKIFE